MTAVTIAQIFALVVVLLIAIALVRDARWKRRIGARLAEQAARYERMTDEQMSKEIGYDLRPTDTSFRIIGGARTGVWDRDEHGWRRRD